MWPKLPRVSHDVVGEEINGIALLTSCAICHVYYTSIDTP